MGSEQLVGEARARRPRRISARERTVLGLSATAFLIAAGVIAMLVPSERETQPLLLLGLVLGYVPKSRPTDQPE